MTSGVRDGPARGGTGGAPGEAAVRGRVAVMVMSYGTPGGPDDVEAYYTDVRRGRPPTPAQLADLVRRYEAIGGVSPLAGRTAEQVAAIGAALDRLAPGRFVALSGTKHGTPRLEDAVARAGELGATALVGLVLAPHYSRASVGEYVARAEQAARDAGLPATFVRSWHDDPVLVELLGERLESALGQVGVPAGARVEEGAPPATVLVTAHSLPSRVLVDDPYEEQLGTTARLLAARCRLDERRVAWRTAWQSAGRTPEPWAGPDVLEAIRELAGRGVGRIVVCPAGFTADHLEVLYDLDVEAARLARELGVRFARTASLNADPRLAELLARRAIAAAGSDVRPRP